MTTASSQIRVQARPFPRVTAAQAGVLTALLLVAFASGLILGRANSTGIAVADITPAGISPSRFAAAESVISTRWLAPTPAYRLGIMEAMNEASDAASASARSAGAPDRVLQRLNALAVSEALPFHRSGAGHVPPPYAIERYKG